MVVFASKVPEPKLPMRSSAVCSAWVAREAEVTESVPVTPVLLPSTSAPAVCVSELPLSSCRLPPAAPPTVSAFALVQLPPFCRVTLLPALLARSPMMALLLFNTPALFSVPMLDRPTFRRPPMSNWLPAPTVTVPNVSAALDNVASPLMLSLAPPVMLSCPLLVSVPLLSEVLSLPTISSVPVTTVLAFCTVNDAASFVLAITMASNDWVVLMVSLALLMYLSAAQTGRLSAKEASPKP